MCPSLTFYYVAAHQKGTIVSMAANRISGGTAHRLPPDLRQALAANQKAVKRWEDLTPLARNEWICWTTFVKQDKTRQDHVRRVVQELNEGKRRPCCWLGCIHRKDKPMNATQRWITGQGSGRGKTRNG